MFDRSGKGADLTPAGMLFCGELKRFSSVRMAPLFRSRFYVILCKDDPLADRGIMLTPGFANDHNGEFAWVPFDCPENIPCVLGYHREDTKESTRHYIELTQEAYIHADAIPL